MVRKTRLVAIITGDIIKSRTTAPRKWLSVLKKALGAEGTSPRNWEIYRGDSFQLKVKDPANALRAAIRIKAHLKTIKGLDARMAIGIGGAEFPASKITESNGEAFVYSGETLAGPIIEKQNLAVKSKWADFDRDMNVCLRLGLIAMDDWTTGAAEMITILIDNPEITQTKLAKRLKITQSAVSGRQKRAYYHEIMELETLFREKIEKLTLS